MLDRKSLLAIFFSIMVCTIEIYEQQIDREMNMYLTSSRHVFDSAKVSDKIGYVVFSAGPHDFHQSTASRTGKDK